MKLRTLNDVPAEFLLKKAADKHWTVTELREEVKKFKSNIK